MLNCLLACRDGARPGHPRVGRGAEATASAAEFASCTDHVTGQNRQVPKHELIPFNDNPQLRYAN